MQTLKLQMRRLTARYSKDIRTEKMARAYAHVYDHCYGAGRSAYQQPVSQPKCYFFDSSWRFPDMGWRLICS